MISHMFTKFKYFLKNYYIFAYEFYPSGMHRIYKVPVKCQ